MLQRQQLKIGDKVYFGRERGQKTLGKIVKLNFKNAKVEQLEERTTHRIGAIWNVPYNLLEFADLNDAKDRPAQIPETKPLPFDSDTFLDELEFKYQPFLDPIENAILAAISAVYSALEPEMLTGDGEIPPSQWRRREASLHFKLRELETALGRKVSAVEISNWNRSKREYELSRAEEAKLALAR